MAFEIDGTYVMVAHGVAGTSVAICTVSNGKLVANDLGGARYSGTVVRSPDGKITFDLELALPPGGFLIWGTAESETTQVRRMNVVVDEADIENGAPVDLSGYGTVVNYRKIGDEYAPFAAPDGFGVLGAHLLDVHRKWENS